jgi:hypothetical protein
MCIKLSLKPGAYLIPFFGVNLLALFGKLDPFTIEEFLISALKRSSLQIIVRKFITKDRLTPDATIFWHNLL